jgi:hypothetical protein
LNKNSPVLEFLSFICLSSWMKRILLLPVIFSMMSCQAESPDQPVEAGKVSWGRDLDAALAACAKTGKPVFALFQEIPGCAGCQQFGRDVLSNSLLVEAIETEFTPLLIHNNKPGKDAEVLRRFGEPAWNYQVVRFLDSRGADLIPRREHVWDTGGIATRMIAVLEKSQRPVPSYLRLLAAEHSLNLKQAVFTMFCFWTGEMALGQIDGVITTEAGFMQGREVTQVRYDPALITLPQLIAAAERVECARAVHVPAADLELAKTQRLSVGTISGYRAAPASDQKKQISSTRLERLPLSAAQATKVNAWIRSDAARALSCLSPSQSSVLR